MKSTKTPIIFDELKEGVHEIRLDTISRSSVDNTFDIFYKDSRLATMYFQGSIKLYAQGFNKSAICKKRLNLILQPLEKIIVEVNHLWFICNKSRNTKDTDPKIFNESMIINS
jgi:hypothetical protein